MGTKLHLGCGDDIREGYINIDEFNANADLKIAIQMLAYPDSSIERIEGYHVVEHLSLMDFKAFLQNAYRMLERGGSLILECPDIEKVCRLVMLFADAPEYLEKGAFGLRGIFGEPSASMTEGDLHKWAYTPALMATLLREAGFLRFEIKDGTSHCYPLRDMRVEATK